MLAAPASGSGKTVLTLALLRALGERGVDIRAAKAGPDYIDPAFHAAACGAPSVNLDPWAMAPGRLQHLAAGQGGSHLMIEAMMGLFDGAADGSGSAAELAAMLGIPVLLAVDAAKQSHSIAALAEGFARHRDDVRVAGIVLNKVGSARHEHLLRAALEPLGLPVIGAVPRDERLVLAERHLGLVQAQENDRLEAFVDSAAGLVAECCDLTVLESLFEPASPVAAEGGVLPPLGQRIAIARDAAFAFCYRHMLEDWRAQGAELSLFSPLGDEAPAGDADAVFLPGGYPELHAGLLAEAGGFKAGM
ncbi:MAG: cobyrinate a,c-diamide synthase, partial [Nitratireductor sp.]|nr:cobyrinate a,c-diamide synthase [Nitratireductor sp.]